jgi:hypothetical protein
MAIHRHRRKKSVGHVYRGYVEPKLAPPTVMHRQIAIERSCCEVIIDVCVTSKGSTTDHDLKTQCDWLTETMLQGLTATGTNISFRHLAIGLTQTVPTVKKKGK